MHKPLYQFSHSINLRLTDSYRTLKDVTQNPNLLSRHNLQIPTIKTPKTGSHVFRMTFINFTHVNFLAIIYI